MMIFFKLLAFHRGGRGEGKGGATNLKVGGGSQRIGRWGGQYSKSTQIKKGGGCTTQDPPPAPKMALPLGRGVLNSEFFAYCIRLLA